MEKTHLFWGLESMTYDNFKNFPDGLKTPEPKLSWLFFSIALTFLNMCIYSFKAYLEGEVYTVIMNTPAFTPFYGTPIFFSYGKTR